MTGKCFPRYCSFEQVLECVRRLLLTGLLVFLQPDSSCQLAFGCMFAFIRLPTNAYQRSYFIPKIEFDALAGNRHSDTTVPTAKCEVISLRLHERPTEGLEPGYQRIPK